MSQPYRTRDTGEGLTLRSCGIKECEPIQAIYRPGKTHPDWTFSFEDSDLRQTISTAFYSACNRDPLDLMRELLTTSMVEEDVAAIVAIFVRLRKEFFVNARYFEQVRS